MKKGKIENMYYKDLDNKKLTIKYKEQGDEVLLLGIDNDSNIYILNVMKK